MTVVLGAAEVQRAAEWAALPVVLRSPPWGFAWASALLPQSAQSASVLRWAVTAAAAFALAGLFTRVALWLTALGLTVLLALTQQWGAGVHTHHLLWFTLLLAAGPSGESLSVDAFRKTGRWIPEAECTPRHGVPVLAACASLGLIFFFPGCWKLLEQGLDWALSDNVKHQLWFKWVEHGALPFFRLDLHPWLLRAGGLFTLAIELLALPMLLWRRTRLLALLLLLAFHAATQAFFFIGFSSLWLCYAGLLPWARWTKQPERFAGAPSRAWPVVVLVLSGQLLAGASGVEHGWPFACYPTFRHDPGRAVPTVRVTETFADGTTRVQLARPNSDRDWGQLWSLLPAMETAQLARWWSGQRPVASPPPVSVRFERAWLDADPDAAR